jgi:hypothetical protein
MKSPAFRTRNKIFKSDFESERVFCKNKNSILTQYTPYTQNKQNETCFEFRENTKVGIYCLSQGLTPHYPLPFKVLCFD